MGRITTSRLRAKLALNGRRAALGAVIAAALACAGVMP